MFDFIIIFFWMWIALVTGFVLAKLWVMVFDRRMSTDGGSSRKKSELRWYRGRARP
jgi:hypothetical protein